MRPMWLSRLLSLGAGISHGLFASGGPLLVFALAGTHLDKARLRATLVNPLPQGDVLLAQQVFTVQQPATAPNAAAGVQAMVQAVDTLGQQLVTWMDGVLQHQR